MAAGDGGRALGVSMSNPTLDGLKVDQVIDADRVAATLGFFGATPITRPSGTSQGALSTGNVTSVTVTGTSITTTGVVAGFQTLAQVTAALTAINSLITEMDATKGLVHALRAALGTTSGVGIIKGGA